MPSLSGFSSGVSGAVSDIFSAKASEKKAEMFGIEAQADLLKGKGAELEGKSYARAHDLALTNKAFSEESTAVQLAQTDRAITMSLGATRAAAGASGLQESGSAVDVLAASAQQGALQKEVLQKQGLITAEGYQEQADVYTNMVAASGVAVEASKLAHDEHLIAADMEKEAATGKYISGGIKGVFAIANLFV